MENNTLFRFATLRSPEPIKKSTKDKSFILYEDLGTGRFYEAIIAPKATTAEQIDYVVNLARDAPLYQTENEVREACGDRIYDFANWLAKNRVEIANGTKTIEEYTSTIGDTGSLNNKVEVWDNLISRSVLNSKPNLREQLIQLIVADFCLQNLEEKERALARVVIPKILFVIDDSVEENNAEIPVTPNEELRSHNINLSESFAKSKINQLEIAITELKKAEQLWNKENKKRYDEARVNYDANNETLMANAEVASYINPITQQESFYYVNLNLPKFTFEPLPQVTADDLQDKISQDTHSLFQDLGIFATDNTFQETYKILDEHLQAETEELHKNFAATEAVAVVGNAVSYASRGSLPTNYSYIGIFTRVTGQNYKFLISVNAGYVGVMPYKVECTIKISGGATFTTTDIGVSSVAGNSGSLVLHFFENSPINLPVNSIVTAEGIIKYADRLVLTFGPTNPLTIREGSSETTNSGYMLATESGDVGDNPSIAPTSFGIQKLGVADYRKVEQTVCGYLPGEVSHIENIMAKEYKERSTRRLRKSEETTTTERQTEKENLTDSTTTDRYEMQSEVASIIQEDTSKSLSVNSSFSAFGAAFNIAASYANNVSQQQSNSQAVTYAKDVTNRAVERVVTKVREERVLKIVEEFEEKNAHGFDNRGGANHISGVYRWIDKVYKNKVLNYGKRLMYEFAVPEPARFHIEAMKVVTNNGVINLDKPIDPRSTDAGSHRIASHTDITRSNYGYWGGVYNAVLEAPPEFQKTIGQNFSLTALGGEEGFDKAAELTIPKGYFSVSAKVKFYARVDYDSRQGHWIFISVGNCQIPLTNQPHNVEINYTQNNTVYSLEPYTDKIPISVTSLNYLGQSYSFSILIQLTDEEETKWKIKTFNAIISAYEVKKKQYEDALADAKAQSVNTLVNPSFYRQIENIVLKKTCISYIESLIKMGRDFYIGSNVTDLDVVRTADMDAYTSRARFIEQAFEWDVLSYNFYPFYWGRKTNWKTAYQTDCDDALFRSFLQAGLARVIVSVRPGFEEAVMYFMSTGKVWNGGQVPTIGDPLYLSIIDELKNPVFEVAETWLSRIPSTLTIIQDGTIGLAASGLPYSCEAGTNTGLEGRDEAMGVILPPTQP